MYHRAKPRGMNTPLPPDEEETKMTLTVQDNWHVVEFVAKEANTFILLGQWVFQLGL